MCTRLPDGSPCIKIVIYTAAVQEAQPIRLYSRLLGVRIKISIYTAAVQKSKVNSDIYTAVVCPYKIVIYTAAI